MMLRNPSLEKLPVELHFYLCHMWKLPSSSHCRSSGARCKLQISPMRQYYPMTESIKRCRSPSSFIHPNQSVV
ncbi:hypothetical protein LINGRAHAP2_LOCUS30660 [Linum grandiflorum]